MRSGPACEFKRTDGHEYWRYFLLEQRGEESHGRRGDFVNDGIVGGFFVPGAQIFNETGATLLSEHGHDLAWLKATAKVPGSEINVN